MSSFDFSKELISWYNENKRDLPWRNTDDPYAIWVSEIMLQQTRVEAVKPYYHRFLEELPDVSALSMASEEKLHKLWEGLGYYSRVRNMQKAARTCMEQYGGKLPADHTALLSLCGIGEYTAAAVASIAFGIPMPAIDGNVLRVMKAPKAPKRIEKKTVFILHGQSGVALEKRPAKGLLAGLWQPPFAAGHLDEEAALSYLKEKGCKIASIKALPPSHHVFTHIIWEMQAYEVALSKEGDFSFFEGEPLLQKAIPSAFAAYRDLLSKK